jgi:hypothetical protein
MHMLPGHRTDSLTLLHGDVLDGIAELPDDSVDSVVTDPPYELGYAGKSWDSSGIAYSVKLWGEVLRVLKPGGHLLAFGATRTYHRVACAIEDAGFQIRDCLTWNYGTGFPKSLSLGEGRGTALKPGHEPIVMARKPLAGTVAQNLAKFGTGVLYIDASRVEGGRWPAPRTRTQTRGHCSQPGHLPVPSSEPYPTPGITAPYPFPGIGAGPGQAGLYQDNGACEKA